MNERILFDDTDAFFLFLSDQEKEMYPSELTSHIRKLQSLEEIIHDEE